MLTYLTEDDGVDITVAATAAKSVLASGTSSYMLTLEWLHELWSWCPEAFETNEWDDHVAEFDSWLRDDLGRNAEDMSDPDELELVERIAELYELDINDDTWAEAEDTVNKNKAERDAQIDADPSYERPSSGRDIANERQEIEGIFVGLAE